MTDSNLQPTCNQFATDCISRTERRDCGTCRHAAKTSEDEPCRNCYFVTGDKWEPREG